MRILGLIPARGGSKRLPGKNIRPLAGIPLIAWTIRSALASGVFSEVLVSTDDPAIAEAAICHGASVPWMRPAELATDTATSMDVVLHALSVCESSRGVTFDSLMLLQPTSPFRSVETILRAEELHLRSGLQPIVSICAAKAHPEWCFRMAHDGNLRRYLGDEPPLTRSQDLPPAYQINGAVYLATTDDLRQERSFVSSRTKGLVVPRLEENIDIDDDSDWQLAECLAAVMPTLG